MVKYDRTKQGERLRMTLLKKMDALYKGRTFDVVKEVHLPKGKVFETKYGAFGRHGFIIRDRETGEQQVVGVRMLERIHELYLGVTVPSNRRLVQRFRP